MIDKKATFKLSYGLFFIGAKGAKINACVANTAIQVTSEPMKMSVTLNKNNYTTDMILKDGYFSVSVMNLNCELDTISRFGFSSGLDKDKFSNFIDYKLFENNVPYITLGTNAVFNLRVEGKMDVGTHVVIFGEIIDSIVLNEIKSLTYADYHALKNGTTPKNAPSYIENTQHGYKCDVCGYVYTGETFPLDFICPICGRPHSVFKKI